MNPIIWIAIAAFVSTLLGGLLAIRFKKALPFFFAFSTGTLIAVAFLDLLPESLELAESVFIDTKYIFLTIVLSFLFYSFLEKYFLAHHHHEDDDHGHILGPIGAGSLVIHSFLDGAAIGAAFLVNPAIGIVVALAVISHDFTDGINTVTLMLKNKHNSRKAMIFLFFDALAPVLGIIFTSVLNINQATLAFILAFFVGEFLYIGAANLLPETHKHKSWLITLFMIFGSLLIYLLSSFVA